MRVPVGARGRLKAARALPGRRGLLGVFADGYSLQPATVTGSVDEGCTISLNVPV